eukprot:531597_1
MTVKLFAKFNTATPPSATCSADNEVDIFYSSDGIHYTSLGNTTAPNTPITVSLSDTTHLSRLRFKATTSSPPFLRGLAAISQSMEKRIPPRMHSIGGLLKRVKMGKIFRQIF